jgi:multiple sugar transport system substrate-binding protein
MKRRLTVLAAAAALATLGLSACSSSGGGTTPTTAANLTTAGGGGGGSSTTTAPVTLKLLGADYGSGPSNTTQKYWQTIADAFHKANPSITVDVNTINWTDYDTKVKTQIQNHQFPDILQGEFFPQYVTDNLLAPVSDVVSDPNMGISTFKNQFSVNGQQYALPFTTSARAMFYNKLAFAKAHISSPPQDWAELEADAKKLKTAGYIGFGLPLGPEEAQAESFLWMLGNGGGWQNAQGKYDINSAQNVQTFTFLKKLVSEGVTNPTPATYNRTADSAADFAAGKVGMEFNGPFLTQTISAAGKLKTSDYATAPVPGKNGPLNKTLGVADAIQVFKTDDANKLAAIKKFMDYALNNQNQLAFAKEYALLPGTQSAADTLKSDPVLGAFIKALPNTVTFPTDNNWTATVLPAIKQSIGTAVAGDPKSVLDALQAKAES